MKIRHILAPVGLLSLIGCSSEGGHDHGDAQQIRQQVFLNGGFEEGTHGQAPPHWQVTSYTFQNSGVTYPPTTRDHLNLQTGGTLATFTWEAAGGPESQTDPSVGPTGSLRWPKYGNKVAIVNFINSGRVANSLRQTMTVSTEDVDPSDGRAHVRFTIAPVLEDPGHPPNEQPYYFVQLRNITKNTVLYQDFNASAQPGVPWKTVGAANYTDWQLVDIAPGDAGMGVGDQVELEVIASRCSLSGHYGRVYVDGVGPTVPGLYVSGSGPSAANAGDNITYQVFYSNGGASSAQDVVVNFTLPTNTTFHSLAGHACTTPAAGQAGVVSCPIGAVAPGGSGSFALTATIAPSATGTITAGNYEILGAGTTPLLGPKVYTSVTTGVSYADLAITKTNNVGGVGWGQPVTYQIVATNHGPSNVVDAPVVDVMPAELENVAWSCVGTGGGSCADDDGTGDIDTTVSLPVGATAAFQVTANVIAGSGSGTLSNTATITPPSGISDTNMTNNSAVDTDMIGELGTVTVSKYGGAGTVVSTPSAINCGPSCSSVEGAFVQGMTVTLNAVPAVGEAFLGWGGACSGTSNACTFVVDGNQWVAAIFETVPRNNGQSCSGPHQCTSGFCVDGVCCNSACGDAASDCQSCSVSGSVGTCTVVPAGTECAAASCSAGVVTPAALCDGSSSQCQVATSVSCDGLACEGSSCKASCDNSADCVGGFYCDETSGNCHELVEQGNACSASAQCASGHCVDGVCCNNSCSGQCEACNLQAAPGVCLPVTGAPQGGRAPCASDESVCGGICDGSVRAACTYPTTSTECGAPSCTGGVATLAALCDGSGTCAPAATQPCGEFVCGDTMCLGDCSVDEHCAAGLFCSGGLCVDQLEPGTACGRGAQCESGQCVDGLCCDTACDGQCEACDVAGSEGTCVPVTGQPHGGRTACAGDGSLCAGACDGELTASCVYPDGNTECRAAACSDGLATVGASCNGAGACPDLQTQDCGSFECGASACLGDCTIDAECAAGSYCSAGVCTPRLQPGSVCSGENQCASGHCVDGVCCDAACTGQCEACDVLGAEGTCSPVVGAPHGARTACSSDGSLCGGQCNGADREACGYPGEETACRAAACTDGVATLGASCDGQGECPDVMQQDCGTFQCGTTSCMGDCSRDADCALGSYCSAGVCAQQRDNGQSCSSLSQCQSGHCVDGVCCDTSCSGQCAACDVQGSEGTCSAVEGAPRNGRAACLGEGPCAGLCDGETLDHCMYPGSDVTCREASCSSGFETTSAQCNRGGLCHASETVSCGNYACGGETCATSCQTQAQCASGMHCVDGACVTDPPAAPSRDGRVEGGGFGCSTSPGGSSRLPFGWMLGLTMALAVGARRRRSVRAA